MLFDKGRTWPFRSGWEDLGEDTIPEASPSSGTKRSPAAAASTLDRGGRAEPQLQQLDGVLFDKGRTRLIQYPAGRSGGYLIPDSVTAIRSRDCVNYDGLGPDCIGDGAFKGSDKLTGVSIPRWTISIGAQTFTAVDPHNCHGTPRQRDFALEMRAKRSKSGITIIPGIRRATFADGVACILLSSSAMPPANSTGTPSPSRRPGVFTYST